MYLVARQGDAQAKDPLVQADEFTTKKTFAKLLTENVDLSEAKAVLTYKNNNQELTKILSELESIENLNLKKSQINDNFSPEGEKITVLKEDDKYERKYDAIFEVQFYEYNDDFFKSVNDLLNPGGIFICTFMIYQEAQLKKKLLNFMLSGYSVQLEAQKIPSTILPFVRILLRKPKGNGNEEMAEDDGEEEKIESQTKIVLVTVEGSDLKELNLVQTVAVLKEFMLSNTHSFAKIYPGRRVTYDIYFPELSKDRPKYTLHIFDSMNEEFNKNDTYACYIVPEGYEETKMYRTVEGNQELADMIRVSRLAIAILVPGSLSCALKDIQNELESVVLEKKPLSLLGGKLPFLTDGDFYSMRKIVHQDENIIVEDYLGPEGIEFYRRLLLVNNYKRVQAEIRLIDIEDDLSVPREEIQWGLYSKMEGKTVTKALKTLDSSTQRTIYTATQLFRNLATHKKMTILGFGVGLLGDFIKINSQDLDITGVEVHQSIIDSAKKYFFMQNDFNLVNKEAFAYIEEADENSIDVLVVDLDSEIVKNKRDLVPKGKFREDAFFAKINRVVKDEGYTIYTIIHNSLEDEKGFETVVKKHFGTVLKVKALGDDQKVYILSKTCVNLDELRNRFEVNFKGAIVEKFSKEDFEEHEFQGIYSGFEVLKLGQEEEIGKLLVAEIEEN